MRLRTKPGVGAECLNDAEQDHSVIMVEGPGGRGKDVFHVRSTFTVGMLTRTAAKEFGVDQDLYGLFLSCPIRYMLKSPNVVSVRFCR